MRSNTMCWAGWCWTLCWLLAALGCTQNADTFVPGGVRGPEEDGGLADAGPFSLLGHGLPGSAEGSWTYLVYMLADNDLEKYLPQDLGELMSVGSEGQLTILAQVDRADGVTDESIGGLPDFTGAKRLRVDPGALTELEDLGEINSGTEQSFGEFLKWGLRAAPADHYAVVLWDHGGAWARFGLDRSSDNDGLSLPELTRAVDGAIGEVGLRGPIDLIGFDACLMGTLEVAAAMMGRAHYLLASEELEPGHGWDHAPVAILKQETTPDQLGSALIAGYAAQAAQQGTEARITLALTDLTRVPGIGRGLGRLIQHLAGDGVGTHTALIGKSRAATPAFGTVPRGYTASMVDLLSWVRNLAEVDPDLTSEAQRLELSLAAAVVDKVSGPAYPDVGGLSVYFPLVQGDYAGSYDELGSVDAWRLFVNEFHDKADRLQVVPVFADPGGQATLALADPGVTVSGTLAPGTYADVALTTLDFGLYAVDGTAYFLGQVPATLGLGGSVTGVWDERVMRITQGAVSDYASFVEAPASGNLRTLAVPIQLIENGENLSLVIMLAVNASGNVISQRYYASEAGAWAEHVALPGASFVTLVPTLSPGNGDVTNRPQIGAFDATLPLGIEFVSLQPGTNVFVRLSAMDYAGQSDAIDASGTL